MLQSGEKVDEASRFKTEVTVGSAAVVVSIVAVVLSPLIARRRRRTTYGPDRQSWQRRQSALESDRPTLGERTPVTAATGATACTCRRRTFPVEGGQPNPPKGMPDQMSPDRRAGVILTFLLGR